jgi:hypothetical protein
MPRQLRSRQDYYAASADPSRISLGADFNQATSGPLNLRPRRTIEEMRRRPEAVRTGAANLRRVGVGMPYLSGVGKAAFERGDITSIDTPAEAKRKEEEGMT